MHPFPWRPTNDKVETLKSKARTGGWSGVEHGVGVWSMSARHAVQRRRGRFWWTVAGGNAALGVAALVAFGVSDVSDVRAQDASSAEVAATPGPRSDGELGDPWRQTEVGDGWATAAEGRESEAQSSASRATRTPTRPTAGSTGSSTSAEAPTPATTTSPGEAVPTAPSTTTQPPVLSWPLPVPEPTDGVTPTPQPGPGPTVPSTPTTPTTPSTPTEPEAPDETDPTDPPETREPPVPPERPTPPGQEADE
ncbi:hypothetical protein ACI797_16550 [Geodermatophilus sp. SYSU D00691]